MNRIILIGNGFDLAHGLKTRYSDFIEKYMHDIILTNPDGDSMQLSSDPRKFSNVFFEQLLLSQDLNWVDIEREYYDALKRLLFITDLNERSRGIIRLNKEFRVVKKYLEKYLSEISINEVKPKKSISDAVQSGIYFNEISFAKIDLTREILIDNILSQQTVSTHPEAYYLNMLETVKKRARKEIESIVRNKEYLYPVKTLILNFNYTKTAETFYKKDNDHIINIHGELNSNSNPMIFGYGDELDVDYKNIENLQDNNFLINFKAFNYLTSTNYRKMLEFIHSGLFQVFIMGHSCGNSDRTLLNTIFEHVNCISIKPFFHLKEDGSDNYLELIQNISRNFNNKPLMRDSVVNKTYCRPLVEQGE